jgi:hypothetical protein
VAADIADVSAVAAIDAAVATVAGISSAVSTVAAADTAVSTVATSITNVNTVAADIAKVNTVANNIVSVDNVSTNMTNVNAVAGVSADVASVAANANNVNIVATNIGNVNQVGPNITSVNTAATNIAAIQAAPTQATNAAASATAAAASAAAASAVVLGNEPVRPTIRPTLNLDFANVKALDPRITFTRASSARYYDGKTVAKAEQNLLLRSQEFDNASWVNTGSSETANTSTAPDGTATADTLNEETATGSHSLHQVPSLLASTTYTLSCFIKNVDAGFAGLAINTATSNYGTVEFNLSGSGSVNRTDVLGTGFSIVASSITDVGNSWFRCVATITLGSASVSDARTTIYMSDGSSSFDTRGRPIYTGTSKTIEVWGAQLEQRSSVTAYTPTTTAPITNYVPVLLSAANNVARFDHNPVTGESLGLLIEESRTNLLTYSEQFDDASWSKTAATVTANTIVAPDGTLTADAVVEDTTNSTHRVFRSLSGVAGATHTHSCYVKAGTRSFFYFDATDSGGTRRTVWFDVSTGTVGTVQSGWTSVSIVPQGNGWFRCSASLNMQAGANLMICAFATANGINVYTGNGQVAGYLWGAQLEVGAFPTSYIPTVASQVTRSNDVASMTGANFSSWYRADEGSVYSETQLLNTFAVSKSIFDINSNSTDNRIVVRAFTTGSSDQLVIRSGATTVAALSNSPNPTTALRKTATAFKNNDFAFVANSSTVFTDTSGLVPAGASKMLIGSEEGNIGYLNGTISKLAFYPKRITNAELQGITTV